MYCANAYHFIIKIADLTRCEAFIEVIYKAIDKFNTVLYMIHWITPTQSTYIQLQKIVTKTHIFNMRLCIGYHTPLDHLLFYITANVLL